MPSLLCDIVCAVITGRTNVSCRPGNITELWLKSLFFDFFTLTMAAANSPETSVIIDGCTWHLTEGVIVRKREFSSLSDRGMACTTTLAQLASSGFQNGIYYWRFTVKIKEHPLCTYVGGEKSKQCY